MEVPGKRRRGMPKQRCLDNIKNDLSGRIVRGVSTIPSSMEASHKKHRPHIKVGKDTEEDRPIVMELCITSISFKFYNGNSILDNGVSKYEPVCTLLGIPSCKYINVIIVTWYICNHLAFLLNNVSLSISEHLIYSGMHDMRICLCYGILGFFNLDCYRGI